PRLPRRRRTRPDLPHRRQPRPHPAGQRVPGAGHRRKAVSLLAGALLRGRVGPAARRPAGARLPRLAGATARPAGRRAKTDGPGAVRPENDPQGGGPMNDLGIALVWLAVQVTAVALAGLGLTALAARQAPGAGASAALTALAATAVLAVVAC